MDKRELGQTGIQVSPIGIGTVKFGRNEDVKYPEAFEIPSEEFLSDLLSHAKKIGINMLDTAPSYGSSEERLGRLLQGQRSDWIIVGKGGETFIDGDSAFDFTADGVERSLMASLERLQTNYIDIFLLHSCGRDIEILNDKHLMRRLHSLKEQKLIRAYGASTKTIEGGIKAVEETDIVMAAYNPAYRMEEPVLDRAQELNKGVLLKKALNSGHLTNMGQNIKDPVQTAMDLAFSHNGVTGMIVGTINKEHLSDNVRKADIAIEKTVRF